jgi:quercetin dioxygenase-like cupin family protein
MAQKGEFSPNRLSFDQGLARIAEALKKRGLELGDRVLSSRDPAIRSVQAELAVSNVPNGFVKWQLPVALQGPSQMFVTVAEPGIEAPPHSHDEGDGIRFIAGGSIIHEGRELTPGDWMFIPAGKRYSFQVGPYGAIMCYCYCCCCA